MMIFLNHCAYCEQKPEEIVVSGRADTPDTALTWVMVGASRIQLCPDCRHTFAGEAEIAYEHLLDGPIDFPPGVTAIEHTCPQLEYEGKTEEEATTIIKLARDGPYFWAKCPHCGIEVRSPVEEET